MSRYGLFQVGADAYERRGDPAPQLLPNHPETGLLGAAEQVYTPIDADPSINQDLLSSAIRQAQAHGRFGLISKIGLLTASATGGNGLIELTDETLENTLRDFGSQSSTLASATFRTFLIPWAVHDHQLAITADALLKLCSTLKVPILFVRGLLEHQYWVRPGNGLFVSKDEDGTESKLEIFYRYSYGRGNGRAYVFTSYDFAENITTNLCVHFPRVRLSEAEELMKNMGRSSRGRPLALHTIIASYAMDAWNQDGSTLRSILLQDEQRNDGTPHQNVKQTTTTLHGLSKDLHVLLENLYDLDENLMFLIKAREALNRIQNSLEGSDISMLEYIHSRCTHARRWVANYRDRANIRINLAFHLSTQVDNDLNLQISKATTAIARDTQRDSSSMITIAAVTMLFLPGTFVSAIFGMVFFDFQEDASGTQTFQVSDRWWYFLAATIPLTVIVFVVWIVWQKLRFTKQYNEGHVEQVQQAGVETHQGMELKSIRLQRVSTFEASQPKPRMPRP